MARNVLFVEAPWARFGSSLSMLTLARALDPERYRPHVAVHADNPLLEDLAAAGIPHLPLPLQDRPLRERRKATVDAEQRILGTPRVRTPTPSDHLKSTLRVARDQLQYRQAIGALKGAMRRWDIDLLHLNNQPSTNRFGYLAVPRGMPLVQHVRDAPLSDTPHLRRIAHRVDRFVCISEYVADWVRVCYDAPAPLTVVPNPISAEFLEGTAGGRLRQMLGLAPDDVIFAQVGRLIPWKGQDIFVRAFIEALDRLPPGSRKPKCVLIGSSVYGDELRQEIVDLIAEKGLADSIFLAPYDNDLRSLLGDCDVLVHYTRKPEAFGRVIIEAMACGAGVICSPNGGLPEIVSDGRTGLIVDSPEALTEAIVRTTLDADLRGSFASTARTDAEAYRDIRIAAQVMDVYDALFEARSASTASRSPS